MIAPSLNPLATNVKISSRIARKTLRESLQLIRETLLTPPVQSDLSVWSDNNIVLGATSPEPGLWRTDRTPYLREILDVCGDFKTQRVVVMASAQVGKTSVIINTSAFYIAQDPCPIMIVQPDKSMAESFSIAKLEPIIQESPILRKLVVSTRKRDGGSKRLEKVFNGNSLVMVSAKSAPSLRGRTIRVLLLDEIDAYDATLGDEGDPVRLAEARTSNFPNRKIILTSTPTVKHFSRIEKEYERSDQRKYHVACPHCQHRQVLRFGTDETPYGLKWQKGNPDDVKYLCESCNVLIDESSKLQMLLKGEWVKANPSSIVAGFHISALYSPWTSWREIAKEWLELYKLPDKRQSFYNLKLGEPYEDTENTINSAELIDHISVYGSQVPKGVGVLVAGVDVQESWIEAAVWGYGIGEEMWLIDTVQLMGQTSQQQVWDDLAYFLRTQYKTYSGDMISIERAAVDTGYLTSIVFKQLRDMKRTGLSVIPIKGFDGARSSFDWSRTKEAGKLRLGMVGTHTIKHIFFSRLKNIKEHGGGYVHLPSGVHEEILAQLLSERKVVVYNKHKVPIVKWEQLRDRNEQLDCVVYSYAILQSLGIQYLAVKLPENVIQWGQEPIVTVSPRVIKSVDIEESLPTGFTKRTVLKMPKRQGGLISRNWLK